MQLLRRQFLKERTNRDRAVMTVDELAGYLEISRHSAYAQLRAGAVPHLRLGKRFIIPRAAIEKWMAEAGRKEAA